jgi:hypothetical protein
MGCITQIQSDMCAARAQAFEALVQPAEALVSPSRYGRLLGTDGYTTPLQPS